MNFIITNFNYYLPSALEQFEILTFRGPELGIFSSIISFFIPKQLFGNLNLSLLLVFFYLIIMCDLKKYLPTGSYNFESISISNNITSNLEKIINGSIILELDKKTKIINYNYYDLPLEITFLLYKITNFVYNQILENLLYFKSIFLNYTLSLFLFLLTCNIFGMIPYSLTVTSYLILTLNMSGMSFFSNLLIALKIHGLKFFKFFVPNGVSGGLVILMVVIELISYIARLFSMAIRLFANMLSGHALIKILSGLVFLSFSDIFFFGIINIIFNIVLLAVTALEVIVAALQSYVFVVLSTVYTNEAIVLH